MSLDFVNNLFASRGSGHNFNNIVDVFCTGKNRVVKITYSSSEMVL
jgi:hypothetical protein